MVAVLVERMLPTALANDAQQNLLTWMHMRIAVIRLVWILGRIVGVHVIGHGASVDQEVRRVIGLSRDVETAPRSSRVTGACCSDLCQGLGVNVGIHLGKLEEIFPVVASLGMVVGGRRKPEIRFFPVAFCHSVLSSKIPRVRRAY